MTKAAKEIIVALVDKLAPQVEVQFAKIEDPKEWLQLYLKLLEYGVPKIAPLQSPDEPNERDKDIFDAVAEEMGKQR